MVSTRRTPHKQQQPLPEEGKKFHAPQGTNIPDQEPTSNNTESQEHKQPPVHVLTTATQAAGANAQLVFEMQRKWRKPTSLLGRLRLFMRTMLFRTDYILGAYFFDWWETAIVYTVYFLLLVVACLGASKQLCNLYVLGRDLLVQWGAQRLDA